MRHRASILEAWARINLGMHKSHREQILVHAVNVDGLSG
jgi:hypothetical protein